MNDRRRKILYIEPVSDLGGVSQYILRAATYMDRLAYEQHFAASGHGNAVPILQSQGVIVHNLPIDYSFFTLLRSVLVLRRFLQKQRFDIIHAHTLKAALLCILATRGLSAKTVFTGHGWRHLQLQNRIHAFLISRIETYVARRADWLTFLNNKEEEESGFRQIYRHKSSVISYSLAVPAHPSRSEAGSVRSRWSIPENALVIAMIGRITAQKDPQTFALAAAQLSKSDKRTFFVWIGDGEERGLLENAAREYGFADRFLITGYLMQDDARALLSACDITLFTSLYEGLPLGILESMAYGVPIVAANVGGIGDVITSEKNGFLFPARDSAAAVAHVMRLKNEHLRSAIATAAHATVAGRFSPIDKMSNEFGSLYRKLLS